MSSIIHSLCMVLTLFLVQNGSVERTSAITYELYIALTSFSGDFCRSEHMSPIRHIYARYLAYLLHKIDQLRRKAELCTNYTLLRPCSQVIHTQVSIGALSGTLMDGIDLVLVQNGSVKQKSSSMHELYFALTSFLDYLCINKHMSSIMHALCMVLTLVLVQNGAAELKSSVMH